MVMVVKKNESIYNRNAIAPSPSKNLSIKIISFTPLNNVIEKNNLEKKEEGISTPIDNSLNAPSVKPSSYLPPPSPSSYGSKIPKSRSNESKSQFILKITKKFNKISNYILGSGICTLIGIVIAVFQLPSIVGGFEFDTSLWFLLYICYQLKSIFDILAIKSAIE